jgi:hypothetical protein
MLCAERNSSLPFRGRAGVGAVGLSSQLGSATTEASVPDALPPSPSRGEGVSLRH